MILVVKEGAGFYRAVEPESRPYQRHISAMRKSGDIVLRLGSCVLRPLPRRAKYARSESVAEKYRRHSQRSQSEGVAGVRAGPCATRCEAKVWRSLKTSVPPRLRVLRVNRPEAPRRDWEGRSPLRPQGSSRRKGAPEVVKRMCADGCPASQSKRAASCLAARSTLRSQWTTCPCHPFRPCRLRRRRGRSCIPSSRECQ